MKKLFGVIDRIQLSPKYQEVLLRKSVSPDLRIFAKRFVELQDKRNLADYDPTVEFTRSEAQRLVIACESSIGMLERSTADERIDVLALLLVTLRD
jgi:hypothetical protein